MAAVRAHLRALALYAGGPPLSRPLSLTLFAAHLLGLTAVFRLAHWPLWPAPVLLAALGLLLGGRVERLVPFGLLYALAGLRLSIVYGLGQPAPAALSYSWALAISLAWTGLIWLRAQGRLRRAGWIAGLSAAGLMIGLLWINRPAGVTGSDPFAYAQMGLDLARHGRLRHHFPLAPLAASLGLPTLPVTHVGYVLPNAEGLAPTVWPPGYGVLLGGAYLAAGEGGMLALNVLIAGLSLGLTAWLARLICPPGWRRLPLLIGLGASAILATSLEQFTRLTVPLADGAAQALTSLTLVLCLCALRTTPTHPHTHTRLGFLTGLALAAAYSVRYTQVLAAPGIALLAWLGLSGRPRQRYLLAAALGGLIGAAPDLVYRTALYGAPWRFGTGELALFSWRALPEAMRGLGAELFARSEFGLLWPLALAGTLYLWRRNRRAWLGLAFGYGPILLFHLWYPFLKLRDLLSLYAPLAALSALGGAAVIAFFWRRGPAARLGLLAGIFGLAVVRLIPILSLTHGVFTFGYLYPEQRQALDSIGGLTEPEAVVACSLNSGAVELYGGRSTVRPGGLLQPQASWSTEEWLRFAAALRQAGRPLYVLMDSPEMEAPLAALQARYRLAHVADLDVPVFYGGGGVRNQRVPLYRVEP